MASRSVLLGLYSAFLSSHYDSALNTCRISIHCSVLFFRLAKFASDLVLSSNVVSFTYWSIGDPWQVLWNIAPVFILCGLCIYDFLDIHILQHFTPAETSSD